MKTVLFFVLIFTAGFARGQGFSYPVIARQGRNVNDFVPPGWRILDKVSGDLNHDNTNDAAVILQYKDTLTVKDTSFDGDTTEQSNHMIYRQPRILLILLKDAKSQAFYLIAQSNTFIILNDNKDYMEDPYQEMSIKKGVLQISFGLSYSAGSWDVTNTAYKFRYRQNSLTLIGADYFSVSRATSDYDNYSYNFLTGKRRREKGNYNKGIPKVTWKQLSAMPLKTLSSFKEPFSWKIEENVLL